MNLVAALTIGAYFGAGVGLMMRRDLFHLGVGTMMLSNAAILYLVCAGLGGTDVPIGTTAASPADPLVQALALTAVVIGCATTVLLMRIGLSVFRVTGRLDLREVARKDLDEPLGESR